MAAIIVYYSLEGNTDAVAKRLAELCGADLLRLEVKKAYPSKGLVKFLRGGKSALMAETPELLPYEYNADKYDTVVFGFPVWASNVAPPLRSFIKQNPISGKRVFAFACLGGSGAEKAFAKLSAALGIQKPEATLALIEPKRKPSAENEAKIERFAALIAG